MADPGCHTRAYPFSLSLFTSFSLFRVLHHLTWITHLSGTRPDPTFPVLAQISTFSALAQILPFPGTQPDLSLVLSWISPFRYSLGFLLFRYSPGSHLSGTRSDPTFPVLARISTFPTLTQILSFPDTCPDPSLVLARIPPFSGTRLDFHLYGTHLDSTFFGTRLDFYFSGTHPDSTISWYSPRFHLSDTHRDSTFSDTHLDPTFSGACPDPSPELARIS